MRVVRTLTPMAGARAENVFVGRAAQVAEVVAVLSGLPEGRGGTLLLEGEAGIGKSRLLEEALRMAGEAGATALVGGAEELDRTRPFRAVAGALGARTGSSDERRVALAHLLLDDDAVGAGHRVEEACLSLIEQTALQRPTILVLDDLQWADPSTLAVVRLAARQTGELPLVIVGALRPRPRGVELSAAIDDLVTQGGRIVQVPPFDDEEARALVGGGAAVWNARAGGNPFFLIELARALGGSSSCDVPPGLHDVLLRRVRQLPGDAVELLRVASVLGTGFTLTDLALVLRRSVIELVPLVSETLAAGLLIEAEAGLRFRHDLIREALHAELPRTVAAALHLETGWALAAAGADALRVAPHLMTGAQPGDGEAIAWLRRAAHQAGRRNLATGIELLDAAAGLAAPRPEEAAALAATALPLLAWAGRVPEALDRGERILRSLPSPALEGAVRRDLAEALVLAGRDIEAAVHAEAALRLPDLASGTAATLLAFASRAQRDRSVAGSMLDEALRLVETSGDLAASSVVLLVAAHRAIADRHLTSAASLAAAAVEAARASAAGDDGGRTPARLFYALQLEGVVLHLTDRAREAIEAFEESRRLATELGANTVLVDIHIQLGICAFDLGSYETALTEADAIDALVGDELASLPLRYPVAVALGEDSNADRLWKLHEQATGGAVDRYLLVWHGRRLLAADRPKEALAILRASWDQHVAAGDGWPARTGSVPLVRVALDAGERVFAEEVAATTVALAERDPDVVSLRATASLVRSMVDDDVDSGLHAVAELRTVPEPIRLCIALVEAGRLACAADRPDVAGALATEAVERAHATGGVDLAGARALREKLSEGRPKTTRQLRRPRSGWESLTTTELRVVEAVVEGLSNPQIAERLFVSRHTVESHMKHVFVKLGIRSRVELAAQAVRRSVPTSP